MPYPIENKLVIAVASSALFNLIESDGVFKTQGDDAFFLGIDKTRVLNILKPYIFFDDQMVHLNRIDKIPAVPIPFGIANK